MNGLALLTTFSSFVLIIAGGLVTSTGSGLAVPDWPLSYGTLFPPMVGGIRFEHSHRMIAATVGLLTCLLTLRTLWVEPRRWVRRLATGLLSLILLQGVLGGLTVLLHLPPSVSVAHACLGQTFFATMVILTFVTSRQWLPLSDAAPLTPACRTGRPPGAWGQEILRQNGFSPRLRHFSLATTASLYGQLIFGALLRHTRWSPPLVLLHILGACTVVFFFGKTVGGILIESSGAVKIVRLVHIVGGLLIFQFLLGLLTYLKLGRPLIATAHVAVGALLLATSAVLTLSIWRNYCFKKRISGYLELMKPRLTTLAAVTSLIGFLLGSAGGVNWWKLCVTLLGTAFVGGGAGALNHYLERELDAQMQRTKGRPLPSGRLSPDSALAFGVACSVAGLLLLSVGAHPLAGGLAAVTLISYLLIYTPLKRRTALCTLIGAIPGAIPPLMGWVAARGRLGLEGYLLFSILFLWQLPHFLAIAWTYRDDYARARFKMLPVLDPEGASTGRQITLYCLALLFVSLLPTFFGLTGPVYFLWALVSGIVFLGYGLKTAWVRSGAAAHRLFVASVLYLPGILFMMMIDRLIL